MSIGVPVRTLDRAKEKTANAGPSWKGIRKFIYNLENQFSVESSERHSKDFGVLDFPAISRKAIRLD